ncbi:MAG: DNA polymerase I [Acidobacteriota bacterium]|nr:DNA polymerase I [Acidobacteriota bacterium]
MTKRLYLVDGMSHIYRAYHAVQGLTNAEGISTNAVYGFTIMLRKLIGEEKPDYLGIAMDLAGPTIRHEQYSEYKATRRPAPDDLLEQLPYIERVCGVLRIPLISCPKYEADDVIGTLTRQAVEHGLEVVIVTIDKDMFQLVSDCVVILDTRDGTHMDPKKVEEKFGAPPQRVVDILSLVGDSSDNIPGAPGIGAKGARQLIEQYGSLDQLLSSCDNVSRKSYRESLQQNEDLIRQSQQLVTIYDNLPLELSLSDMQISEPDHQGARELFEELGFTSLLEELRGSSQPSGVKKYHNINDGEQIRELAHALKQRQAALALAYSDGSYLEGTLEALSVSHQIQEAWCLSTAMLQREEVEVGRLLGGAKQWAVHDLKPLYVFSSRQRWNLDSDICDTMLMAYLLNPNQKDFSLERLASDYLHYKFGEIEVDISCSLGKEEVGRLCERADITLQLSDVLSCKLKDNNLDILFGTIELPLVRVLARMEEHGVKVDCDLLKQMSDQAADKIEKLTKEIYEMAGEEFNINSHRQLSVILFEKLNLPVLKKTRKTGHYATGVEVLQKLADSHEIAQLILEYRMLTKLKNTYLDTLPRLVNARTGRIHTSYNQMVAATGRLSSSNPNLQNIPIKSALGREIRRAFVPETGYQILTADYSQIELRVMAHLSEDPVLVEAFLKGEDIHERTAREVFGMHAMMNPQEFRRHAKAINFGVMYGLSAFGLSQSLSINRNEAQQFIDDYFKKYRGVKDWIDRTLEEVQKTRYVTTLFGRIRQIPDICSTNRNLRSFAERTAINAPIQGTAADLIKKAMVSIDKEILVREMDSRLIAQVHDELVFEAKDKELDELETLVKEQMEGVATLKIPLEVSLAIGPSWFEAK